MIVEELWERIHNLLVDVPRYQQVDAIQRLCLEFAAPLADRVVADATDRARHHCACFDSMETAWCDECREARANEQRTLVTALPLAREVLAALKEG